MSEMAAQIAETQPTESGFTQDQERVISAYKNVPKIKSPSAQRAFIDQFLPRMEAQLGLVDFITDDIRDIVRENPREATNIVDIIRNAQRRARVTADSAKAFVPSESPIGDDVNANLIANRSVSHSNFRIQTAIKLLRNRIKDVSQLNPTTVHILRAAMEESFTEDEIAQIFNSLGLE